MQPPPRSSTELLPVAEARARLLALTTPLETESVGISDALGRALTEDLRAIRTLPPWDNSAMDGYAVRSADLAPGALPRRLQMIETIHAGKLPTRSVGAGQCSRIMTGAPLPDGADAVVMQEKVQVVEPGLIE